MSERDEHGDLITDRGFRHTQWVAGVSGYGGRVVVYESSGAAAPRIWIGAEDSRDVETEEPVRVNVHLELADALTLAENIIRTCRLHYQLRGDVSDG